MRTAKRGGRATGFLDLLLHRLSFRTRSRSLTEKLPREGGRLCALPPPGQGGGRTYLQCPSPGLPGSPPSYLSLRESGVLDSEIKFGLILHWFKGHDPLGGGKGRKQSY